jgi:rhodanese-related sulfurtransferase
MRPAIWAWLLFLSLPLLGQAQRTAQKLEHAKDSLDTVRKNLEGGKAILLDVRSQAERDAGYVKDSVFLPITRIESGKLDSKELAKLLPKGKIVYTYCRSGGRALRAAEALSKQGYEVRPLKPGYEELKQAGFPTASKEK